MINSAYRKHNNPSAHLAFDEVIVLFKERDVSHSTFRKAHILA
jgi:hypothetical protein